VAFALHAWLTKADFRLPAGERWWLLPLAVTVFASNYAVVTAYQSSPNIGYVKALGVGELVLVALIVTGVAMVHGQPLGLPWWKLAGMALCVVGAVLVGLEGKKSSPAPEPTVAAASASSTSATSRTSSTTSLNRPSMRSVKATPLPAATSWRRSSTASAASGARRSMPRWPTP
jgi:hypothetical protein